MCFNKIVDYPIDWSFAQACNCMEESNNRSPIFSLRDYLIFSTVCQWLNLNEYFIYPLALPLNCLAYRNRYGYVQLNEVCCRRSSGFTLQVHKPIPFMNIPHECLLSTEVVVISCPSFHICHVAYRYNNISQISTI